MRAWCVVLLVRCPGSPGSCSPVCPLGVLFFLCGDLDHLASVHRCARSVRCFACAVSWATGLLFTGVPAWLVVLLVRCSEPPGSCSPCARSVCSFVCAMYRATWLLFTGVPAWCVSLRVRCSGPLGSCSPVCLLGVFFCLCGVLGHLVPVHRCAPSSHCLCVRCPGPLGSCSPVCSRGLLRCVCGVLGHLAPVHRCAHSVRYFACAVSWATWPLFTGAPARCAALCVRCPGPLGSCSLVCPRGLLCCVRGVLGHLTPVHQCAHSVPCFACAVSLTICLLFTAVPAWCVVLRVQSPGPLGSCSPLCPLCVLFCLCVVLGHLVPVHRCARLWRCLCVRCPGPMGSCSQVGLLGALSCVCGVLGHLAPVHRCARSLRCFACAVSWATWLLFTGVPAPCVVLLVRCPWPLGSCSPMCPFGVLCCVCSLLGHLAPVHRCACSVCCFACAVSWATWLLFTGVPAPCVVLLVRCPWPLGSCSPTCPFGVLCCVCSLLGHLAPVHRCARSVCCFACAVSWATWLLLTGVPACCVACVCAVLGHLAPVHRCACLVRCLVCAVSWATWLLFTVVPARCVVSLVRCPGALGSCSAVCPFGALLCVCGVLGHLALVHRCARSVCCFAYVVSWATWLLFGGAPARRVACVCGVLGHLAPVHRCACSVCCFACAVSWATWLLFTGVSIRCVALCVPCPGPLGSCSPVCPLSVLFCLSAANNKRYGCTQHRPPRMETHATPTRPATKETATLPFSPNMHTL